MGHQAVAEGTPSKLNSEGRKDHCLYPEASNVVKGESVAHPPGQGRPYVMRLLFRDCGEQVGVDQRLKLFVVGLEVHLQV